MAVTESDLDSNDMIVRRYIQKWQSKEISHDFVRGLSVAETCFSHWGYSVKRSDVTKNSSVTTMEVKAIEFNSIYLNNLHTWNLHRKVEYISQTSGNSFGILPQNWTRFHLVFFTLYVL